MSSESVENIQPAESNKETKEEPKKDSGEESDKETKKDSDEEPEEDDDYATEITANIYDELEDDSDDESNDSKSKQEIDATPDPSSQPRSFKRMEYKTVEVDVDTELIPLVEQLYKADMEVCEAGFINNMIHIELFEHSHKMLFLDVSGQSEYMKERIAGTRPVWAFYNDISGKKQTDSYIYFEIFSIEFPRVDLPHVFYSFVKYNEGNERKKKKQKQIEKEWAKEKELEKQRLLEKEKLKELEKLQPKPPKKRFLVV